MVTSGVGGAKGYSFAVGSWWSEGTSPVRLDRGGDRRHNGCSTLKLRCSWDEALGVCAPVLPQ